MVSALSVAFGQPGAFGSSATSARKGGIFRISLYGNLDYVDPALSYTVAGWALLDTTCARLMAYPDKPLPEGLRLVPEVAAAYPRVSRDAKTFTFTLRSGFRFSDGTPVRASAFARAINRTLAPGITSPAAQYTQDVAGADDVRAGKTTTAAGVVARGMKLVVRFTRPVPDFPARTTMPFFCAVPPTLPSDAEGVRAFPAAGPYYVATYRPRETVVVRRNRFYGGKRPHHVDGFAVDLRASSPSEVLDRIERGETDWGYVLPPTYFESGRDLARKYGVNRSQFFVKPGQSMRFLAFNSSRPLFRDNARLRRAINLALDRRALVGALSSSPLFSRRTDQYLPPGIPGFTDAKIYPLERPDLRRARTLARGQTRGGKAVYYAPNLPGPVGVAQLVKRQLAEIGIDVELRPIPVSAFLARLRARDEPWDIAPLLWAPDYIDPYSYVNLLFDGRFAGQTNTASFDSRVYNRLMRRAGRLRGSERYRAYGQLDVRLARDAAPLAAIDVFNEPTLVSKRVGCIVLRPALDLTAACLKR
jgi:peptide/nickel transport system substrate-binding protein